MSSGEEAIKKQLIIIYRRYFKMVGHLTQSIKAIEDTRTEYGTSNYDIDLELLTVVRNKYLILCTDMHEELMGGALIPKLPKSKQQFRDLVKSGLTGEEATRIMRPLKLNWLEEYGK